MNICDDYDEVRIQARFGYLSTLDLALAIAAVRGEGDWVARLLVLGADPRGGRCAGFILASEAGHREVATDLQNAMDVQARLEMERKRACRVTTPLGTDPAASTDLTNQDLMYFAKYCEGLPAPVDLPRFIKSAGADADPEILGAALLLDTYLARWFGNDYDTVACDRAAR